MIRPRRAAMIDVLEGAAEGLSRTGAGMLGLLIAWMEVQRERRALLEMDERMLKDIGLRREDAVREAERLLWRLDSEGLRLKR